VCALPQAAGPRLGKTGRLKLVVGLVGPFPAGADPDAYDRLRRRVLWRMPSGIYLLGSAAHGRRNLMTHNLAMQVATEPKLLAVSVRADALTHELVQEGRVFSLCFLNRQDRALVRGFTKPASEGPKAGMLGGVAVRVG
jgi:flavin reductase (DIM6/NTAB) family NADH-FMN oxidoreductase RutF